MHRRYRHPRLFPGPVVADQPIQHLCAMLGVHIEGRQLDDDASMLFKMADGASGVLIASQVCAGEENPLKIRVYGRQGRSGMAARRTRQPGPSCPRSAVAHPAFRRQPAVVVRSRQPAHAPARRAPRRVSRSHGQSLWRLCHGDSWRGGRPWMPRCARHQHGLRGMAFVETVIANHRGDTKVDRAASHPHNPRDFP